MSKRSTATLILLICLTGFFPSKAWAQTNISAIPGLGGFPYFKSTEEITNYFSVSKVPIDVLTLKKDGTNFFLVATFPYSGVSTIPVYLFEKYGEDWCPKMLYYYTRPYHRKLRVQERQQSIVLFDDDEEIFRFSTRNFRTPLK